MDFRARIDPGRALDVMADAGKNLRPLFQRWIGAARKATAEHFDQEPGPPLAESTLKRYRQERTANVTAFGKTRKSYQRKLFGALKSRPRPGEGSSQRGEAELRRVLRGDLSQPVDTTARYHKAIERLRKQLDRAKSGRRVGGNRRKADRHQFLGKLRKALRGGVLAAGMFYENAITWSGAHNRGARVGNNATLPARKTVFIDDSLRATLAQIVREHFLGIDH